MQMGAMVGMISEGALGLFDAGLPTIEPVGITYLVPNIEAFAADHELDPRQVRLWSALHEVTHEMLVGRSWVRPHMVKLFDDLAASVDLDSEIMGNWQEDLADPARLEARLAQEGGFAGLFGAPPHGDRIEPIRSLMTMVEGYGAYLIDQVAAGLLPDLGSVRAAMSSRHRNRAHHAGFGGLFGMESSAGDYGRSAAFCAEVAQRWGDSTVHRIWERAENLPSSAELDDVTGWAARVLLEDPFA